MTTQKPLPDLTVINGVPRVSSLAIADHFQKRHDHVLRRIRQIIAECPAEFIAPNFGLNNYFDEIGRELPMYQLSRDGFTMLAMGFAGKKALTWKIKYIEAFNAMEKALAEKPKPKALPKPKQKALPAPEPYLSEKGAEAMQRMLRLRADVFRASIDVRLILASPFSKGPYNNETPEHQREFANALNEAAGGFFMAVNNNLMAVEQMFKAYVEAERMLRE